jgi:hypothetical protein
VVIFDIPRLIFKFKIPFIVIKMQAPPSKEVKRHTSSKGSSKSGDHGDEKSLKSIIKDQAAEISSLKSKMKNIEKRLCALEIIIDELEIETESESGEEA